MLVSIISMYIIYNLDIQKYVNIYKQKNIDYYGSHHISAQYEDMIYDIARKMNINESFEIRKMNHQALQLFGYYNAFAYFPQLFNCIPCSNKSFLFVSQGFFEDLTLEEQRFLIGHELIHIKEHHTKYLNLILYIISFLFLLAWWIITSYISKLFKRFEKNYFNHIRIVFSGIVLCICITIPRLIECAYRRHLEWQADRISLDLLDTYNGGIRLMDRWQEEFKVPLHNTDGLFADHPSCFERKMYCINLKNTKENIACI